jgi:hypothetical protein
MVCVVAAAVFPAADVPNEEDSPPLRNSSQAFGAERHRFQRRCPSWWPTTRDARLAHDLLTHAARRPTAFRGRVYERPQPAAVVPRLVLAVLSLALWRVAWIGKQTAGRHDCRNTRARGRRVLAQPGDCGRVNDWLVLIGLACSVVPVLETVKWVERRGWLGQLTS